MNEFEKTLCLMAATIASGVSNRLANPDDGVVAVEYNRKTILVLASQSVQLAVEIMNCVHVLLTVGPNNEAAK